MKRKVLYLSYDGMLEPLGYSQVFQYLKYLSSKHSIWLISFEKREGLRNKVLFERFCKETNDEQIRWIPLRYHKSPTVTATSFDILQGLFFSLYLCLRHRIDLLHSRSYVTSVIALTLKKLLRIQFIFDMRGFWADERVESGLWKRGSLLYRGAKWFEKRFLVHSDRVVSLTHAGARQILSFNDIPNRISPIEVITTCTDTDLFTPLDPPTDEGRLVVGHTGSTSLWYDFDWSIDYFKVVRDKFSNALFLIVTREESGPLADKITKKGIPKESFQIVSRSMKEMPSEIRKMKVASFFIRPTFSKQASAPTKLGEFLACGVPCVINAGVGDSGEIVERERVGLVLKDPSIAEIERGVNELARLLADSKIKQRCREVALKLFSLEEGVKSYDRIYQSLLNRDVGQK